MELPTPGQPITAEILYMDEIVTVIGCHSEDEPGIVLFDFYSGTGAGTILSWEPRELPNKPDAHPWTGIENRGL